MTINKIVSENVLIFILNSSLFFPCLIYILKASLYFFCNKNPLFDINILMLIKKSSKHALMHIMEMESLKGYKSLQMKNMETPFLFIHTFYGNSMNKFGCVSVKIYVFFVRLCKWLILKVTKS